MNDQPTFKKIMTTDYTCGVCIFSPMIMLVLIAYSVWQSLRGADEWGMLILILPIMLVMVTTSLLRANMIRNTFAEGNPASGVIIGKARYRGEFWLTYTYDYQGQSYRHSNRVLRTVIAQGLEKGSPVTLVVDQNNPKKSYIRELFI
jgi:hypothetical protein